MKIEVVAIGDEILRGMTINSNATWISRLLFQKGYPVARHMTLPDDPSILSQGLQEALSRSDLVITTGGLGPTCDDRTRHIAADLFSSDFYFNQDIAADLTKRFGEALSSLKDQATVPSKAKILPNSIGTAPGLIFSEGGKTLILLPGVPSEMQQMVEGQVISYLNQICPLRAQRGHIQIQLCLLNENRVDPTLRELQKKFPDVDVGIYPGYGTLMVSLTSVVLDQLEAFKEALARHFEPYIFTSANGKISEALLDWFVAEKRTLALAESCTGGLMAAQLTSIPGASNYFLGSCVVYSNEMKRDLLGVSEATLQRTGAVSQETVTEMLLGVLEQTHADYAIAISGIAGPSGGSDLKPVGTMWAAMGKRGETPDVGTFLAKGTRETRTLLTTNLLLGALWRKLVKGIPPFPLYPQK